MDEMENGMIKVPSIDDLEKDINNQILAKLEPAFVSAALSYTQVSNDIKAMTNYLRAKGFKQVCSINTPQGKLEWGPHPNSPKLMTILFEGQPLIGTKVKCRMMIAEYLPRLVEQVGIELKKLIEVKTQ